MLANGNKVIQNSFGKDKANKLFVVIIRIQQDLLNYNLTALFLYVVSNEFSLTQIDNFDKVYIKSKKIVDDTWANFLARKQEKTFEIFL